jgi:hypothetical protein
MKEYFFLNRMTPNTEITENSVQGYFVGPLVIKSVAVIKFIVSFFIKLNKTTFNHFRLMMPTTSHITYKVSFIDVCNFSLGEFKENFVDFP